MGDMKNHLYRLKTRLPKARVHVFKDGANEGEDGSSSQGESSEPYKPTGESPELHVSDRTTSIEAALWHRWLGHMSEKGLTYLMKDGALTDMKDVHLDKCEDCLVGK